MLRIPLPEYADGTRYSDLTLQTLGDALLRSPGGQLLDVGVPSGFAVGAFGWMLVEKS